MLKLLSKEQLLRNGFNEFTKSTYGTKCEATEVAEVSEPLLDVIFAPDPITLLPKGDIAVYLSKDTSAEVKSFIQANLMSEVIPDTPYIGEDDELFDFIRRPHETREAYAKRLNEGLSRDRELIEAFKKPVSSPSSIETTAQSE